LVNDGLVSWIFSGFSALAKAEEKPRRKRKWQ